LHFFCGIYFLECLESPGSKVSGGSLPGQAKKRSNMNITTEIKRNHEKLSRRSVQFLDYVSRNPGSMNTGSYGKLAINNKSHKLQSWPTFINPQARNEMARASLKLFEIIKSIPKRIFDNDYEKISAYYGIPLALVKYFLDGVTDESLDHLIARADFILTADGLKCLEYNVNTTIGGLVQIPVWESRYLSVPVISDFIKQNNVKILNRNSFVSLFEHLHEAALKRFPDEQAEINIAVAIPNFIATSQSASSFMDVYFKAAYERVLKKDKQFGGNLFICGFSQLAKMKDHITFKGKKKIHVVFEYGRGYVTPEILDVFLDGNVVLVNGPIASFLSTKLNLALISEKSGSGLFDKEEKAVIDKYLPWTRRVRMGEGSDRYSPGEMKSYILENREDLVLKPLMGYGGENIFVGRYTSKEKWAEVLDEALKAGDWNEVAVGDTISQQSWDEISDESLGIKSWVVQEFAGSATYLYQHGKNGYTEHDAVWGYYLFGNRYCGSWVRAMPRTAGKGIINCHQGAQVSVVFEVDE
jgi:hypothetical protein